MTISFYGEGCFKIQSGETVVLIDSPSQQSGLSSPRFKFDAMVKTLSSLDDIDNPVLTSEGFSIVGPGEYNIKDIDITGLGLQKESSDKFIKTIYLMNAEGIKLCFLGHISEIPEADIAEHLEEIDILFIPAGGKPFIEQKAAVKLAKQIGPKIIMPCFYKIPGLKRPAGDLKAFLEEADFKKSEPQEKLTIKKKDLAEIKKTEVAILKI